jgi:glycosyltransferase involved in cell wall biosynthesis
LISIVLPYWKRAEVARKCLALYAKHYGGWLDFEVVLVDDGSHDFECDEYPWLTIERLPKKDGPKNPCVPINRGVAASVGDVIVLSGPDILHNSPVLVQMYMQLRELGENGYVLAACWYEREKQWHCHSHITADGWHQNTRQPKGSGFHFCAMFNRTLWDRAGGFDEDYRDGAYFDDPDWVNRVARAGAVFKIRDDLVVEHTRDDGAYTDWPGGAADRNKALFMQKWPS